MQNIYKPTAFSIQRSAFCIQRFPCSIQHYAFCAFLRIFRAGISKSVSMDAPVNNTLQLFRNLVGTKFQLYNSLFTSLPFHRVEKTGIFLSLFLLHCEEGFDKEQSPAEILKTFFEQYTTYKD